MFCNNFKWCNPKRKPNQKVSHHKNIFSIFNASGQDEDYDSDFEAHYVFSGTEEMACRENKIFSLMSKDKCQKNNFCFSNIISRSIHKLTNTSNDNASYFDVDHPYYESKTDEIIRVKRSLWRSAFDPKSNRTYYYHLDRPDQAQWEKPIELTTGRERVQRFEDLRKRKEWFAAMESNIRQNLSRGDLFGPGTSIFGPLVTPSTDASPLKTPTVSTGDTSNTRHNFSNSNNKNQENYQKNVISNCPKQANAKADFTLPSLSVAGTASTCSLSTMSFSPTKSERSLTPERHSSKSYHIRTISSMDEMLLVESNSNSGGSCSEKDQLGTSLTSNVSSSYAVLDTIFSKSEEDNDNEEDLEPCSTSENIIHEGEDKMTIHHLEGNKEIISAFRNAALAFASTRDKKDRAINNLLPAITTAMENENNCQYQCDILHPCNANENKKGQTNSTLSSSNSGGSLSATRKKRKHIRSNTEGMVFVGNTMSAPDTDATIKCVCGVYRAHILEQTPLAQSVPVNLDLHTFHDMFSSSSTTNLSPTSFAFLSFIQSPPPPPTLDEIINFFSTIYRQTRMESDCIIISLIYIERLLKHSNGSIRPHATNWKSILLSALILSSKVSDDLSRWNVHFSQVVLPRTKRNRKPSFTLQRINELERSMLEAVGYHVKVKASEYAKYYFLLRSMLIRSSTFDLEDVRDEDEWEGSVIPNLTLVGGCCYSDYENQTSVIKEGHFLERCSSRYERIIMEENGGRGEWWQA